MLLPVREPPRPRAITLEDRPSTPQHIVDERSWPLGTSTDFSIRKIRAKIAELASRSLVGKNVRSSQCTTRHSNGGRLPMP